MKLLFDQNLSYKLVDSLSEIYPDSIHVKDIDCQMATDKHIWNYAKEHKYVIVTQDSDFHEYSVLYGSPPRILWIRTGNTISKHIEQLLRKNFIQIQHFDNDPDHACLLLFDEV